MGFLPGTFAGLLGVLAELIVQLAFELFARFGVRILRSVFRITRSPDPAVAALGYVIIGGVAGLLSLWIWPESFARGPIHRLLTLVIVPLLAGLAMAALGAWRKHRAQELIRLDRFAYAFLFAFALALARFVWAR